MSMKFTVTSQLMMLLSLYQTYVGVSVFMLVCLYSCCVCLYSCCVCVCVCVCVDENFDS